MWQIVSAVQLVLFSMIMSRRAHAAREMNEFAVIQGLKCDTSDRSSSSKPFKTVKNADTLRACIEECAKTKKCDIAHYNKKTDKCKMWKRGKCERVTDEFDGISDFTLIGLVGRNGFFEVPRAEGFWSDGQKCKNTAWKYKDVPADKTRGRRKCIQWCKKKQDCVAVTYNFDSEGDAYGAVDSWCQFYRKCEKGENYQLAEGFFLKPNFAE